MPKAATTAGDTKQLRRHHPLSEEYAPTQALKQKARKKRKLQQDEDEETYVGTKASRKILRIGQDLVEEDLQAQIVPTTSTAFALDSRIGDDNADSDRDSGTYEDGEEWGDEEGNGVQDEAELDPTDQDIWNRFNPSHDNSKLQPGKDPLDATLGQEADEGTNLADLILEKIAAHEAVQGSMQPPFAQHVGGGARQDAVELPTKVVEVYSQVGLILSRYKSGKLPKPFKILPTLPQWEDLLAITRPDSWTPNACYEATRIFVSGKPAITQIFLNTVLLDRVREDIHETKKLNVHLYKALKKALYKPAAFFKGFLFPLVSSGSCTLREAHIVGSVVARVSIPVLHSAAALLRLCEIAAEQASVSTEAGGATNILIRVLLEKKYALPYKVVDALVFHFLRFRAVDPAAATGREDAMSHVVGPGAAGNSFKLPVLWHQCLLAFAQRYRNDITEDQREALLDMLLTNGHKAIGPEVRRELLEGRGRGVVVPPENDGVGDGGDDTMVIDPL